MRTCRYRFSLGHLASPPVRAGPGRSRSCLRACKLPLEMPSKKGARGGEIVTHALFREGSYLMANGTGAPHRDSRMPVDSLCTPGRWGGSGEPAKRTIESR
jgi:hypothetical protein